MILTFKGLITHIALVWSSRGMHNHVSLIVSFGLQHRATKKTCKRIWTGGSRFCSQDVQVQNSYRERKKTYQERCLSLKTSVQTGPLSKCLVCADKLNCKTLSRKSLAHQTTKHDSNINPGPKPIILLNIVNEQLLSECYFYEFAYVIPSSLSF